MKFALLLYEAPTDFAARTNEERATYWGAWQAYASALTEGGVREDKNAGMALEPPATAVTVRLHDGVRQVQDGPFADTKEQIGGFLILEAPTIDEALNWAARCPCAARGVVEVRPIFAM